MKKYLYFCKTVIVILILIFSPYSIIKAQDDGMSDFNKLRTPTSPAFTLLGIAPISVERPGNPSTFAASLISNTKNFTKLPENFSMEFAPYWMYNHPTLTWEQYKESGGIESIFQSTTVSLGTSQIGDSLNPTTGFAIGLKTNLLSGKLTAKAKKILDEEIKYDKATSDEIDEIAKKLTEIEYKKKDKEIKEAKSDEDKTKILKKYAEKIEKIREKAIEQYANDATKNHISYSVNEASEREGLFWDIAGGLSFKFPKNIADSGKFRGYGIWSTFGWIEENWNFIAVARAMGSNIRIDSLQNLIDIGGRIIYINTSYGISLEAVARKYDYTNAPKNIKWRVALTLDYQLSKTLWLISSFGRDNNSGLQGSFLANIGLTYNFSNNRYVFPLK